MAAISDRTRLSAVRRPATHGATGRRPLRRYCGWTIVTPVSPVGLVQSTGAPCPTALAMTPTLTPQTFAATCAATPMPTLFRFRIVSLLSRLVTVTLTSPPVTTGPCARAGAAGMAAIAPPTARDARARFVRVIARSPRCWGWGAAWPGVRTGTGCPRPTRVNLLPADTDREATSQLRRGRDALAQGLVLAGQQGRELAGVGLRVVAVAVVEEHVCLLALLRQLLQ